MIVRIDIDAIQETRERAPYQQPDAEIVQAVAKQGGRNHRMLGSVAVRPVGSRIAPAVQDHDAVDGNLDAIAESRQEHRPRALRLAVRPLEAAGVKRWIIHRKTGNGEMRQHDRTLGAALLQAERGHKIFGGWLGRRLSQHEDTCDHDQRLDQGIVDEAGSLLPPALTDGEAWFRRDVVLHSRIKPCWSASNTASPRVWTSSLR